MPTTVVVSYFNDIPMDNGPFIHKTYVWGSGGKGMGGVCPENSDQKKQTTEAACQMES